MLLRKKTLLIATDSFLPRWDGIARFLYEIIPYLSKHFDVVVAAPKFPGSMPAFDDAIIIRFPVLNYRFGDIKPAKVNRAQLKKIVRNSDLVWVHSIGPIGALSIYYARKYRKPLVSFVHSVDWFLFSKSLKRFRGIVEFIIRKGIPYLYNKCDLIIVPFDGMIQILEQQSVYPKKEVVYLGVDINRFRPAGSKASFKENLGIGPERFVVGYLGRFGREKDLLTLYNAFRKLSNDLPETTLMLVGGKLAEPFGSMENVRIFDSVNDPAVYYNAMDVYVLPSLTETTSLTTMEAMASGLPVVVTPVGYVKKYVKHNANGFVFPFQNSERLYLLLKKLALDPKLREKIGIAARQTMVKKHSWQKTSEELVRILGRF